jgi:hypothetical protein
VSSGSSSGSLSSGPGSPRTRRTGRLAVLAVLALVVVVAVAVGVTHAGSSGTTAGRPTATPSQSGTTFAPGTVTIVDRDAGISYPYLGSGWFEFDLAAQPETTATAGQYFTTQQQVPDGGEFIAQCTSGPLAAGFGYSGPASLAATTAAVQAFARAAHYPSPNEQRTTRDEAVQVDGHAAHVVEWELTWHVSGYDATGERAAVLLVDVGRPAPALLYVSIPNTHAELYGVIDQVLGAVHVL